VIITSVENPKFNNRLIDRLIITAESSKVNSIIVINKIDLVDDSEFTKWVEIYSTIGYHVITTCAVNGYGINLLKSHIEGKVNLFWGQSGVGKSSLLNSLYPHLNLKVAKISDSTSKGRHTTVTVLMRNVGNNTFVIDTPGIREIDPYGIKKEDLGHYFREFEKFIKKCKFNTCTHYHEPGCAVVDAVEKEFINHERYRSYINILNTIEDDLFFKS